MRCHNIYFFVLKTAREYTVLIARFKLQSQWAYSIEENSGSWRGLQQFYPVLDRYSGTRLQMHLATDIGSNQYIRVSLLYGI